MIRTAIRPVPIVNKFSEAAGSGFLIQLIGRIACTGYTKLKGGIWVPGTPAPDAGYPRVVQYASFVATATGPARIDVLAQDASQPNTNYPIDIDIYYPYIGIEYKQSTGVSVTITAAYAELRG